MQTGASLPLPPSVLLHAHVAARPDQTVASIVSGAVHVGGTGTPGARRPGGKVIARVVGTVDDSWEPGVGRRSRPDRALVTQRAAVGAVS